MSTLPSRRWILLLFPALTTCHDSAGPGDPCDRALACEVAGVDLFIPQLLVVADEEDANTGLGIVDPDSVDLQFSVANRGDSVSPPAMLALLYGSVEKGAPLVFTSAQAGDTLLVPPLEPGAKHSRRITVGAWESADRPRHGEWYDNSSFAEAQLLLHDTDTTNNVQRSAKVHVRIAVLEFELALPDSILTVNLPFAARLKISNVSRHGTLPPMAVGFWLHKIIGSMVGGTTGFGTHDMPGIPPLGKYERELRLEIPPTAAWNHERQRYIVITSISPTGTKDTLLWRGANQRLIDNGPEIWVRPDYRACQPALLRPDSVAVSPLVCRNPFTFYVYELQARPDREYSIEQEDNPGATIYSPDGAKVLDILPGWWIHFPSPATYFVVDLVERDPPPVRSMVLRERPVTQTNDRRQR